MYDKFPVRIQSLANFDAENASVKTVEKTKIKKEAVNDPTVNYNTNLIRLIPCALQIPGAIEPTDSVTYPPHPA